MDIVDILASVTRDHHEALGTVSLESPASEKQLDLQLLTRAWVSERVTPELMPYPTELMDRVTQRIREQVCTGQSPREISVTSNTGIQANVAPSACGIA